MTIKQIFPAPPDRLVFYYFTHDDKSCSPWHWEQLCYVAHVTLDDGSELLMPMITGDLGWQLPDDDATTTTCAIVGAEAWLDEDVIGKDELVKYLEAHR